MKLSIGLLASVFMCFCDEIPSIPGDNSHYVEGVSQYIWMPDGNGLPHLQDLKAPLDMSVLMGRSGPNTEYWLYTRENRDNFQIISHGNINSVLNSNFHSNRPTKVIIHGWNNNGYSKVNCLITSAFLDNQNCNVIVLDWRTLANSNYITASYGVLTVGQSLGNFLLWLHYTTGLNWNQIHIVGFSLGAHIAGNAGRICNGRPRRVTGLDPAGPLWSGSSDAIDNQSGQYVEIIHTDAGALGISDNAGHVDFYPNGGDNQPGCWFSVCSHSRAYELFASSVLTDHFVGNLCTNTSQARCKQCNGRQFNMGNGVLSKNGYGVFGVQTGSSWPY